MSCENKAKSICKKAGSVYGFTGAAGENVQLALHSGQPGVLHIKDAPPRVDVNQIDWSKAAYLNHGAFGVTYRIDEKTVVKVAPFISDYEVERQEEWAAEGLALPVLGFDQLCNLPLWLREEVYRCIQDWDGPGDPPHTLCALVMPYAEPAPDTEETKEFMRDFSVQDMEWDEHEGNVRMYQDKYVAIDFGIPDPWEDGEE